MGQTENLSLPDGLQTEIEKVARAQERTVNEVLAEAVDRYIAAHPPDARGAVSVRMVRLEVEAELP